MILNVSNMLLYARTLTNAIAFVYAFIILLRTRKILNRPWAFIFIALRVGSLLFLNGIMVLGVPVSLFILDILKIVWALLDLLTLIEIANGYKALFKTT